MTDKRPPRPPDGTSKERPLNQELLDLIRHELPYFTRGTKTIKQGEQERSWVSYFLEMVQEVESQTQGYFSANMAACMLKRKKELVALLREREGHVKPAWLEVVTVRVLDGSIKLGGGGNFYPVWTQGCDVYGLYLYLSQFEEFSDTEIFAAINLVLSDRCKAKKDRDHKKSVYQPKAELVRKFIQKRGEARQKMIDEALEIARKEIAEMLSGTQVPSSFQDIVK
jgi:hypothetical protein